MPRNYSQIYRMINLLTDSLMGISKLLNEGKGLDTIHVHFSKALHIVFHNHLLLQGLAMIWTIPNECCLKDQYWFGEKSLE